MVTKGYGISVKEINWSCPANLEPYSIAYERKLEELDFLNWQLGQYVAYALDSTVCNSFLWRRKGEKAHAYINEPFSHKSKNMVSASEEEMQRKRELFVAKLEVMKANFEISKNQEK